MQIRLSKIHICLSWKIFFWLLWNSIFEVKIAVFAIQNFLSKGLDLYSVPPVSGGPIWFAWVSFPVYLLYLVGCVWFSCPSLYPRLSPVSPGLSPCLNESLSSPPPPTQFNAAAGPGDSQDGRCRGTVRLGLICLDSFAWIGLVWTVAVWPVLVFGLIG